MAIQSINYDLPGLKFVHINCRSLFKKLDEIISYFKNCEIICCSETWLRPELSNSLVYFPDKILFRLDRKITNRKTRGGGVCIYVSKKYVSFVKVNDALTISTDDFEALSIDITKPGLRHMTVTSIYRPPSGKNKSCQDFLKDHFTDSNRELWILGDFNIDYLDRTNSDRLRYINIF